MFSYTDQNLDRDPDINPDQDQDPDLLDINPVPDLDINPGPDLDLDLNPDLNLFFILRFIFGSYFKRPNDSIAAFCTYHDL